MAYDLVDRTLTWAVLAHFCVQPRLPAVIDRFLGNTRTCVRLDDGDYSDTFVVGKGLRQKCEIAPLLFNDFYGGIACGIQTLLDDATIVNNIVQLERTKEKGDKNGTPRAGLVEGGAGRKGRNTGCGARYTLTMRASYRDHHVGRRQG